MTMHSLLTLFVMSYCELTARYDFGSENGGDAAHSHGLSSLVESLKELLQMWLDGEVLILHCKVTQVLRHTKSP